MRLMLICFIYLCLSFAALAEEIKGTYQYESWQAAKQAANRLQFVVESTKIGLFSSEIDGYVRQYDYKAELDAKNLILRDMRIAFKGSDMDTDNKSRDEKLHNLCLSHELFPEIIVMVPGPLFLRSSASSVLTGKVLIRGQEKPFQMKFTARLEGDHFYLEGTSTWRLSEMQIPDPSIAVAKLSDQIKIEFKQDGSLK